MLSIAFMFNVVICFFIPIGYLVFAKKKGNSLRPFFIGVLTFLISQIFLRMPIIQVVFENSQIQLNFPLLYSMILCFSAGIFEEIGRRISFGSLLKDKRTWVDGITFGIGHAALEAILFVGLNSLVISIALLSPDIGESLGITREMISIIKVSNNSFEVLLSGFERIFAGGLHIALSLFILYGVNKSLKYILPLAILIHGLSNLGAILCMPNILMAEGFLLVVFILSIIFIIKSKKLFAINKDVNEKVLI